MDVGNAYAVGETCLAFARGVRPFLKHVHLKDYSVHPAEAGYRLVRCALGAGLVDWPAMMAWFEAECPGVQGCIELGATTARHVRLLEPDWWATYPERPFLPGAVETLADLHRAARPPAEEWRTPHERGEAPEICTAWEMDQFEASVRFLRQLAGTRGERRA